MSVNEVAGVAELDPRIHRKLGIGMRGRERACGPARDRGRRRGGAVAGVWRQQGVQRFAQLDRRLQRTCALGRRTRAKTSNRRIIEVGDAREPVHERVEVGQIGQATGLVTFYGPGLTKIARPTTPQFNRDHLLRALTATEPLGEIPRDPSDGYVRTIVGGQAEGELVGGALWELVDCDWSEHRPEYPQTLSIDDVLERHLERLGVPALHGLPLGHGEHAFTTPLRVRVALDADQGSVSFLEAATLE